MVFKICGSPEMNEGHDEAPAAPAHAEEVATPTDTYPIRTSQRVVPAHLKPEPRNRVAVPLRTEPFPADVDDESYAKQYWARRISDLNFESNGNPASLESSTANSDDSVSNPHTSLSSETVTQMQQPTDSSGTNGDEQNHGLVSSRP